MGEKKQGDGTRPFRSSEKCSGSVLGLLLLLHPGNVVVNGQSQWSGRIPSTVGVADDILDSNMVNV